MTEDLLTRARELAVYIIENRATIRQAAKHFGHRVSWCEMTGHGVCRDCLEKEKASTGEE